MSATDIPDPGGADRPLVTFFVMGYNQEDTIHLGIESAFAQTYQPLEIILADDGSRDGTFRVMQEMAAAYQGPHRIRLNRNEPNRGITANINRVMELATGAFIVQNNGDDFSVPERTQVLVDAWQAAGGGAMSFHSALTLIDEGGNRIGRTRSRDILIEDPSPLNIVRNVLYAVGASAAWSRVLFDHFGPLQPYTIGEDGVIPMRAALMDGVAYVDAELVFWRTGGVSWHADRYNFSGHDLLYGFYLTSVRRNWGTQRNILEDLARVGDFPDKAACIRLAKDYVEKAGFQLEIAGLGRGARLRQLWPALRRSLATGKPFYVRCVLKYILDRPFMAFADLRKRYRASRRKATG